MQKLLILLITLSALSACVHKMDIEQGNIITQDKVNKLHHGMTMSEVNNILGTPVLMNTFDDHRVDYVYTYQPGHRQRIEKYMTLNFKNDRLVEMSGQVTSVR